MLDDLLRRADTRRRQDVEQAARDIHLASEAQGQRASYSYMIGRELVRLNQRMEFLRRHPKRPRWLGGCAIEVYETNRGIPALVADGLLPTEPELVADNQVKSYFEVTCSSVGTTIIRGRDKRIAINRITEEESSAQARASQLYQFSFNSGQRKYSRWAQERIIEHYVETKTGSRPASRAAVQRARKDAAIWLANADLLPEIRGQELDEFYRQKVQELFDEYAQEHPWAKNYELPDRGLSINRTFFSKNTGNSRDLPKRGDRLLDTLQRTTQLSKLDKELLPRFEPGVESGWDYPDELCVYPLGLLMEFNRQLGAKR